MLRRIRAKGYIKGMFEDKLDFNSAEVDMQTFKLKNIK